MTQDGTGNDGKTVREDRRTVREGGPAPPGGGATVREDRRTVREGGHTAPGGGVTMREGGIDKVVADGIHGARQRSIELGDAFGD